MPRLVDAPSRTDTLVWGVNYLLALHGPTGVTLRALGRTTGISPSSLMHHYGNREHIMRVAAHRAFKVRERQIWSELGSRGIAAFLPNGSEEGIRSARVWLAWQEVHRSDPGTHLVIAEARDRERSLVTVTLRQDYDSDEVREVYSLIEGLLAAVCTPERPLALDTARRILQTRAGELTAPPVSSAG